MTAPRAAGNLSTGILDVGDLIARQYRRRAETSSIGIKVNLYRDVDVQALGTVLGRSGPAGADVECMMVGDSYFMTHLGRPTTRLETADEQAWGLSVLADLVDEVARARQAHLDGAPVYLVADLPDGAGQDEAAACAAADRLLAAGGDVVKVEVGTEGSLSVLRALVGRSMPVMAHLGYTPQCRSLRRYGDTIDQAAEIFSLARRVRDAGAAALVLEMVSEPVNRALSRPHPLGLPVYSIFSGQAPCGGQSLNAWDAVFRPDTPNPAFPPTASYGVDQFEEAYTPEIVAAHLGELLALTARRQFPPSPKSRLPEHLVGAIAAVDPWITPLGRG